VRPVSSLPWLALLVADGGFETTRPALALDDSDRV